jgi:hypothetical protein
LLLELLLIRLERVVGASGERSREDQHGGDSGESA